MKRALLVIDAQKVYTSAESALFCPDSAATIVRVNKLIEKFQLASEPVFYVRHVHQADGSDLGRMFDFAGNWDGQFNFKAGTVEVEYDDRLLVPSGAAELTKAPTLVSRIRIWMAICESLLLILSPSAAL